MIGRTISHYKILEKLGGGGMGVVYKAEDTKLHRIVALKFLPPELTRDEEAKHRFIHEAEAASSLDHNNICVIHEIDETEGQIFICMNYYEGETLKKKIENGLLKIEEAADTALQIAKGLQKAHEKGIVHRDIKPANIFITDDGVVKILDFGLAKLTGYSVLTRVGETLGTTAYMSPEQSRGEKTDQRTDIWSLGVVLYEMVTGRLPFRGDYEQAVIYSIINEEPEPVTGVRSNVPMELEHIISKCIRKNPADRYQHVDELIVDLNALKQEPQHLTIPHPLPKEQVNKKKILIIGAASLFIAVLIAVWFLSKEYRGGADYDRSKSIGVLPFIPFNKTTDDSVFADGIHDDILTQLSKITDLRVIARTSMILYRDTKKRLSEIGDELDVGYLLEGSVRKAGNRIRITAQLINSETEGHVWAETYDRDESDIFAVQTEIASKIASGLNLSLRPSEKKDMEDKLTSNVKAYNYYQQGMYYWRNYVDSAGNAKAAIMFDSAAFADPAFYQAYAWAAILHFAMYVQRDWDPSPQRLQKGKEMLNKALELAPNSPEVRYAKAMYLHQVEKKKNEALIECESILKDRQMLDVIIELAALYRELGDFQKAREVCRLRRSIDPVSLSGGWESFLISARLREWDSARQEVEEYLARHPDDPWAYNWMVLLQIAGYGNLNEAKRIYMEGSKLPPLVFRGGRTIDPFGLWLVYYLQRNYQQALDFVSSPALSGNLIQKLILQGYTYFSLGDKNKAKTTFGTAAGIIKRMDLKYPFLKMLLAVCLAGSGQTEEAFKYINEVLDAYSCEPFIDLYNKMSAEERLVHICMFTGRYDEALDHLEDMMKRPGTVTKWTLSLAPMFDPIRNNERFKKLITK